MKPQILVDASTVIEQKDGLSQYIIGLLTNLPADAFEQFDFSVLINTGIKRKELLAAFHPGRFTLIEAKIAPIGPKRDWEMFWFFRKYRKRFDLFHSTSTQYPLCTKKGIVTIHDITFRKYFDNPRWSFRLAPWYMNFIVKNALRKSEAIIAVSASTKNDLIQNYLLTEIEASKIQVIHEGWEHLINNNTTHNLPGDAQGKYLLYVGNTRRHKNMTHLITAFGLAINTLPGDINLVITGDTANLNKQDLERIEKLNMKSARIIFTGIVSSIELEVLYKNAHAIIFPSLSEGFGIPVLESFYFRKPLLCSNNSSFPEIAGDAALYFDPTRPEDIAASIIYLYQNPSVTELLIAKGAERLEKFSWKKMACETVQLYKDMLL